MITTNHLTQGQLEAVGVLLTTVLEDGHSIQDWFDGQGGRWVHVDLLDHHLAALDAIADLIHEAPAFEPTATYTCPGCRYQAVGPRTMPESIRCPNQVAHAARRG